MVKKQDWQGNDVKNSEVPQTFTQHPIGNAGLASPAHKPKIVAVLCSLASPLRVPSLPSS
jgi:hypothetical protein